MDIKAGLTDQSVNIAAWTTAGAPVTITSATAGLSLWYRRGVTGAKTAITPSDLATLETAHADGGLLVVGGAEHRLDLPDAAVAAGVDKVVWGGEATGITIDGGEANLIGQATTGAVGSETTDTIYSAVQNIATTGSPSYEEPDSYVLTTGTQSSGTYANVDTANSVYHQHTDTAGTLDLYYETILQADERAVSVNFKARVTSSNDTISIQAYDWVGAAWVTIYSLVGVNTTTDTTRTEILVGKYTGTGADLGKVRIRFYGTGLTTATLYVDQCVLGVTTKAGGITNGSTVTLAATTANQNFVGNNWTLALGGQDISGSYFYGAKSVTGIASGSTDVTFECCDFGAATVPPGRYINCGFGLASGTLTAASAGQYLLRSCYSRVPGSGTPAFDWATASGTIGVNGREWHGGSSHTIDSDVTISWEVVGGGGQTFTGGGSVELRGIMRAATLTGVIAGKTSQIVGVVGPVSINGTGGTVNVYGNTGTVTDNSGGLVTITSSQAVNLANINTQADTALTDYDGPTNTEMEARTLPSAQYATATALSTVAGYLDTEIAEILEYVNCLPVTWVTVPTAAQNRQEMDSNSTKLASILDDTGTTIPAQIAALDIAGGTGTYSCTWTVNDGTTALQGATVSFWLNGVLKGTGTTGVAGTVPMSLDAATYTVAISLSGYTFASTTHTVSSTNTTWTKTFSMSSVSISPPATLSNITGYVSCYRNGILAQGVAIRFIQTNGPGTAGYSYDKIPTTFASNSAGLAQYTKFLPSCWYKFARGNEQFGDAAVQAPASGSWALPEFLGQP